MQARSRGPARALSSRSHRSARPSPRRIAVAIAFVVAMTLAGSSASHVRAETPSPTPASPALAASAAADFAARAGYSPAYAAEASDVRAATAPLPLTLTFVGPLPPAAYSAAVAYFRAAGLSVTSAPGDRTTLGLTGPPASAGRAFGTSLAAGVANGVPVVYPTRPPALPAALESEIAGVVGLSEGFARFSFDLGLLPSFGAGPSVQPGDANTVTPDLARQFYDFGTLTDLGGSETYPTSLAIAVVLWGNGPSPADLSSFFNDSALYPSTLPKPTLHAFPVAGAPRPSSNAPNLPDGLAVEELTLDTEWAASMAPGATIDIVYGAGGVAPTFSPSTVALTAAVRKAVALDPSVISMSFGAPDSSAGSLAQAWAPLFAQAQANNTTLVAATGDTGGDANYTGSVCSGGPSPEFPASDPQVLAAGGTNVSVHLGVGAGYSESGWGGSGGGFSDRFSAPTWQTQSVAAIRADGHRGMPDVSSSAADDFVLFNGTDDQARGTSFASPLWAGLVADVDAKWGHRLGFFTPSLYHIGSVERSGAIGSGLADITSGSNCVASATTGWDAVTGWGSPHAAVLFDDLLGSFVRIDLHLSAATVGPGGTVSVSALVTNRTSGAPIVGVPVNLSIAADTDLGPCTGGAGNVFDAQYASTNGQGWVYGTLSVPVCYLGQHALVNASVTTTKFYGTSGERVGVNLLGFVPQLEFLASPPYVFFTYAIIVGAACVVGAWLGRPRDEPPVVRRRGPPAGAPPAASPPPPPPPSTSTPPPAAPPPPAPPAGPPPPPGSMPPPASPPSGPPSPPPGAG